MASFTFNALAIAPDLHVDPPTRIGSLPARSGNSWKQLSAKKHAITGNKNLQLRGRPVVSICASSTISPSSKDTAVDVRERRRLEDVVIAGSGIAGLATAVALHRVGVKSIVLEQSDSLRTSGATIGLWTNAWRALDALGIADKLRENCRRVEKMDMYAADGKLLSTLNFPRDVELRGVDRKLLLETLKQCLPHETIQYNAKVIGIRQGDEGHTEVQIQNGSTIVTKVLVGCDGIGSVVAKWMGFKEPRYVGQIAIRGVAVYTKGHEFSGAGRQVLGKAVRFGMVPVNTNRVYWFVVFNSSSVEKITDLKVVMDEALSFVQDFPDVIKDVIKRTPLENLSRRALSDRWLWPVISPPLFKGGVTLAGDAMHPITPNLGQGGCCALEEGVMLGRTLSKSVGRTSVTKKGEHMNGKRQEMNSFQEMMEIEKSLESYTSERWHRMFPLGVRSYLVGTILNLDSQLVGSIRNRFLSKVLRVEMFIGHTLYDCGPL